MTAACDASSVINSIFQARAALAYHFGELAAVSAGQAHIGGQSVRPLHALLVFQSTVRVDGLLRDVPQIAQDLAQYSSYARLVVSEQHRLAEALGRTDRRLLLSDRHLQCAQVAQQVHIDRRSLAQDRINTRVSPGLLRKPTNYRQTEARPLRVYPACMQRLAIVKSLDGHQSEKDDVVVGNNAIEQLIIKSTLVLFNGSKVASSRSSQVL